MEITNEQRIVALKQILTDRYYDHTNLIQTSAICEALRILEENTKPVSN